MMNTDGLSRRKARRPIAAALKQDSDEFHETLAAPIPNHGYRRKIDLTDDTPAKIGRFMRIAIAVLFAILALFGIVDWLVR